MAVIEPSPEPAATGFSWDWLAKYALPALPVAGLLVYGLLRQLYAIFFGSLGASPEEVGLGYSEILALSALGALWLPLLAVVSLGAITLLVKLPGPLDKPALVDHAARAVTAGAGVAMIAVGVFTLLAVRPGHYAQFGVIIGSGCALLLLAWLWPLRPPVPRRDRPLAVALFAVYSLLLGGALLQSYAHRDADLAYSGVAVRSVNLLGLQVLGLRAEPAVLSWRAAAPADLAYLGGRCLMYLGETNDTIVLFDPGPRYKRTIRLKASDVVVTVLRELPNAVRDVSCSNTADDPAPPGVAAG